MPRQNQVAEAKSDKKSRPEVKPTVVEERTDDLAGLARLPGGPIAAMGDGTIQAQAAWLGDRRLQRAQRQALAAQIGLVQGNQHLQRVIATLKRDEQAANPIFAHQQASGNQTVQHPVRSRVPRAKQTTSQPGGRYEQGTGQTTEITLTKSLAIQLWWPWRRDPEPSIITDAEPEEETERPGVRYDPIEPPEAYHHHIYRRLDTDERGRPVGARRLQELIREAQESGYRIIRQRRGGTTRVYAEITISTQEWWQQVIIKVNGVSITVRNVTREELENLRGTLQLVPAPHLEEVVGRRRRIVLTDWTGAPAPSQRQYGGGANILRARPEIGEEEGPRIEITHTAMMRDGGRYTVLHEIGHVVYDARLIPRGVVGSYGTSSHIGPSEAPAYAYMYYLMERPLCHEDKRSFDAAFTEQGLSPRGGGVSSSPRLGCAEEETPSSPSE